MTRPRAVVVDTNVLVAGLLTSDSASLTAVVLDVMLAAELVYLLSEELLAEHRSVLLRPAIAARHGLSEGEVDQVLAQIIQNGIVREPSPSAESPPDRNDQHLWDLAGSEGGVWVVTGDRLLREGRPVGLVVVSARELVAALG